MIILRVECAGPRRDLNAIRDSVSPAKRRKRRSPESCAADPARRAGRFAPSLLLDSADCECSSRVLGAVSTNQVRFRKSQTFVEAAFDIPHRHQRTPCASKWPARCRPRPLRVNPRSVQAAVKQRVSQNGFRARWASAAGSSTRPRLSVALDTRLTGTGWPAPAAYGFRTGKGRPLMPASADRHIRPAGGAASAVEPRGTIIVRFQQWHPGTAIVTCRITTTKNFPVHGCALPLAQREPVPWESRAPATSDWRAPFAAVGRAELVSHCSTIRKFLSCAGERGARQSTWMARIQMATA